MPHSCWWRYSHYRLLKSAISLDTARPRCANSYIVLALGYVKAVFTSTPNSPPHCGKSDSLTDAIRSGDLVATVRLLLISDGRGRTSAARRPVQGADAVARFLIGITSRILQAELTLTWINGEPAAIVRNGDTIEFATFLIVLDDVVQQVLIVRNPDKLKRLERSVRLAR